MKDNKTSGVLGELLGILKIEKEEWPIMRLLLLNSFFIGLFVAVFFSFANGLFVSVFDSTYLPYSYLGVGVFGYVAGMVFSKMQTLMKFTRLALWTLVILAGIIALFRLGLWVSESNLVLVFFIFISIMPLAVLLYLQFWGSISGMFDLRQSKRLFPVIGTGDVVSSIVSFLSVPMLTQLLGGANNLLFVALAGLAGCFAVQSYLFSKYSEKFPQAARKKAPTAGSPLEQSLFKKISGSHYLTYIALVAVFSTAGLYFIDFSFMLTVKARYHDKESLVSFFAFFFAMAKFIELVFKTYISGRLLDRYGVQAGLSALPLILLLFMLLATLSSFFFSTESIVFLLFIMMAKLFERVVRKSVEEPTFKILFQPLKKEEKLPVQSFIEGQVNNTGVFIGGATLLLFTYLDLERSTVFFLFVCATFVLWLVFSFRLYGGYRKTIQNNLLGISEEKTVSPPLSPIHYIQNILQGSEKREVIKALGLLKEADYRVAITHLETLLLSPHAAVRLKALDFASDFALFDAETIIRLKLLPAETIARVRRKAEETLESLKKTKAMSDENTVKKMVLSTKKENRRLAALLIRSLEFEDKEVYVKRMIDDPEASVSKLALLSLGQPSINLLSLLVEYVKSPFFLGQTLAALGGFYANSRQVRKLIAARFDQFSGIPGTAMGIFLLMAASKERDDLDFLFDKLNLPDRDLQFRLAQLLADVRFSASEGQKNTVRTLINEECAHYAWLLAASIDLTPDPRLDGLAQTIDKEAARSEEMLLLLLSMLYDAETFMKIKDIMASESRENQALAFEMLDMALGEELKPVVGPIIEKQPKRLKLLGLSVFYPQKKLSPIARLDDILQNDYQKTPKWLKAIAIEHIAVVAADPSLALLANLYHPDMIIKEAAYISLFKLSPEQYARKISGEAKKTKLSLAAILRINTNSPPKLSIQQKIIELSKIEGLEALPTELLAMLAQICDDAKLMPLQIYEIGSLRTTSVCCVLEGRVKASTGSGKEYEIGPGRLSETLPFHGQPLARIQALSESRLLYMPEDILIGLAASYTEIAEAFVKKIPAGAAARTRMPQTA